MYPTIDMLVNQIPEVGPSTLLYKIDLKGAYRNLRVDPGDYLVLALGIQFSLKQGASRCTLCTKAITLLMASQHFWVMNYLDDVLGVTTIAVNTFLTLRNLLDAVGLPVNNQKVMAPASELI